MYRSHRATYNAIFVCHKSHALFFPPPAPVSHSISSYASVLLTNCSWHLFGLRQLLSRHKHTHKHRSLFTAKRMKCSSQRAHRVCPNPSAYKLPDWRVYENVLYLPGIGIILFLNITKRTGAYINAYRFWWTRDAPQTSYAHQIWDR